MKAGTKLIELTDFRGGLNFSVPPENLEANELYIAKNVEYDELTGTLRRRPALSRIIDTGFNIDSIYYAKNIDAFLLSSGQNLYKWDGNSNSSPVLIGTLSGSLKPKCCLFGDKILIASGGKLQVFDNVNLTTITTSQNCSGVSVKSGRVVIWNTSDDNLYFSGVGDETNWNFSGTDADAQYVEIGYKDGGNIVAVCPLAKDFIIFKSSAIAYRLVGDYPNWAVYEVSRNARAVNENTAVQVLNDVVFLDMSGLKSLATVVEYGDIKQFDLGRKVNSYLVPDINSSIAAIWHIYKKNQIWIKTANNNSVWVYYYPFKAWTKFDFYENINDITIKGNNVYVVSSSKIYILDSEAEKDDETYTVTAIVGTKKFISKNHFFVFSMYGFSVTSYTSADVTIQLDKASHNYKLNPFGDIAYNDNDIAYFDTDPVVAPFSQLVKKRQTLKTREFSFRFLINRGSVALNSVFAYIKEV